MKMHKTKLIMLLLSVCILELQATQHWCDTIMDQLTSPDKQPIPLFIVLAQTQEDAFAARYFNIVCAEARKRDDQGECSVLQDRIRKELYKKGTWEAHALHWASYHNRSQLIGSVRAFEREYKLLDPPFDCCAPSPLEKALVRIDKGVSMGMQCPRVTPTIDRGAQSFIPKVVHRAHKRSRKGRGVVFDGDECRVLRSMKKSST